MSSISNKSLVANKSGIVLFSAGIILCFTMWAALIWGDFEASLFAASLPAEKHLSNLRCPVVVARNETGKVSFQFRNTSDRRLSTNVRTYVSQGYMSLIGEFDTPLRIEPDEVETFEWQVDAKNAVWNRLIMVRIYTFRQYPYPAYTGTCGILVIGQLPFSGEVFFWGILIPGVIALISGAYLIGKKKADLATTKSGIYASLVMLVIIVLSGLALGLKGNWLPSLLLLLLAFLLLVVALANKFLET